MSTPCSTHAARTATGTCVRCAKRTCALCVLDVDGVLFCSVLCFTEQALASKGRTLPQKRPDPLASVDFKEPPTLEEPSVVLRAEDAEVPDDSSVMMSAAEAQDRSETSILDMSSPTKRRALEESSVAPVENRLKDQTSILGMGSVMDPPKSETPLPMVLPGTRRSTIRSACVFHADTPAVVMCSKCGDSICTMCIADEEQGGRCSPACRRDLRRARRNRALLLLGGVGAAVLILWAAFFRRGGEPKPDPGVVAAAERAKADAEARGKEAEQRRREALAAEEARLRVEARAKEEAEKKAAEEARAKAEAEAKEAALKAEAEAKAAAIARAEAVRKAEADAKAALAKAEAEAAAKAAKERAEVEARAKAEAEARAKAEAAARAKAEAERKAKEEARAAAEAKARAEALAKAKAEAEAKALAVEKSLQKASGLIREATPAFCALAALVDSDDDGPAVLARIDAVASKLSGARSEYAALVGDGPSRELLERRIAVLGDLLAALREFRARFVEER